MIHLQKNHHISHKNLEVHAMHLKESPASVILPQILKNKMLVCYLQRTVEVVTYQQWQVEVTQKVCSSF